MSIRFSLVRWILCNWFAGLIGTVFVVYATDQVEARYILSISLMRRLLEFRARVKHPLAIAFVDSNLYLAISTNKLYRLPTCLSRPRRWLAARMRQPQLPHIFGATMCAC